MRYAILIVAGLFLAFTSACNRVDEDAVRLANLRALQDSVRVVKLREGQLEYARRMSVLSKEISVLREELRKVGSAVEFLARTEATVIIDTVEVPTVVTETFEGLTAAWAYEDNLVRLSGLTAIPRKGAAVTRIDNLQMQVVLTSGLRELRDGNFEFFVRPADNRVSVSMDALIVNRRRFGYTNPRKWVLGVGGGYGLGSGGLSPTVGLFVGRRIFAW